MANLTWFLRRLRAMSLSEILHRLLALAWMMCRRNAVPSGVHVQPPKPWTVSRPRQDDPARRWVVEEADAYLDRQWLFFGLSGVREPDMDWQRDPESGKSMPLRFAPRINFREQGKFGSIKNIWEKNRHHHLTVLSAAFLLTGAERYSWEVAEQILHWVRENPFLTGANWISPMECGIRLISWVWCERFLRGSSRYEEIFGPASPVWKSIYQHQLFIARSFARGSTANNHVIGEMAGQLIASTAWPFFDESNSWRDRSARILEEEIVKQTYPSGINREHAFGYHLFVAELFTLALVEASRTARPFSEPYPSCLRKMIEAIPALTDTGGNLPRYGDDDGGAAVQLQAMQDRRDTWIFDLGRILLGANVPATGLPSMPARLMGFPEVPSKDWKNADDGTIFSDAGLCILSSARGTPKEMIMLFDAGPQGYLDQAAHGHADALSFTLSVGGKPILVDTGTFCYHADPAWRNYFRGTQAHNTVTVDGQDQSVPGGTFLWLKRADARVVSADQKTVTAEHDGYARLPGHVIHRRRLALEADSLSVEDEMLGTGDHQLEWRFHFAPDCAVILQGTDCAVRWNGGELHLALDPRLLWFLAHGSQAAGWYSPSFGVKVPSFTLCGELHCTLPCNPVVMKCRR